MITFKEFILEGKIDDLRKIYVDKNKIQSSVFDKIVELDPSDTNKYVQWMIKRYIDPREDKQNIINRFKEYIPKFDNLSKKKRLKANERDIGQYKTVEKLYDVLKHYDDKSLSKSQISKGVKNFKTDIDKKDVVFDNTYVTIVKPPSEEKSCKYGAGTKWCTAANGHSNYFSQYYYDAHVTLYYILPKDKSDKQGKVAVAVYDNGKKEIYDKQDNQLSQSDFAKIAEKWEIPL